MEDGAVQLAAGSEVAGRYRIESRIGEGGMAVVYRARHVGTDSPCALKFIHPRLLSEAALVDQFLNEARIAAKIGSHPHIVKVFDTGLDGELGIPFIAMELLSGRSLRKLIAKEAPVAWDLALALLAQLADALDEAHDAGIVHRDLKPSNVFVTEDRRGRRSIKVLDFGIAKLLDGGGESTATEVGTPWYNAPEQLGSKMRELAAAHGITIASQVSAGTDIWALGLIACELLCGMKTKAYWSARTISDQMLHLALDGRESATARAGVQAKHLPPGFDDWFLRCLRHNSAERFPSAGEAIRQLGQQMGAAGRESSPTTGPGYLSDPSGISRSSWSALSSGAGMTPSGPASLPSAPTGHAPSSPPAGPPPAGADWDIDAGATAETTTRIDTAQSWHATLRGSPQRTKVAVAVAVGSILVGALVGLVLLVPNEPAAGGVGAAGAAAEPAATSSGEGGASEPLASGSATSDNGVDASGATAEASASSPATAGGPQPPRPPRATARPPRANPPPDSDPFGRAQR